MIRRAIGFEPNNAEAHRNLGVLLAQSQQFESAAAAFSKAAQLRPDDVQTQLDLAKVHYNLGIKLANDGRLDEAIASHSRAIQLKPDFAMAHFSRGHALRAAGRLGEAVDAYSQAVHFKADLLEAHATMAAILGYLQRFNEAMECHARAVALQPDAAICHEALGGIMLQQRGAAAAVVHYRRAVEKDPLLISAWNSLGLALQSQGEFDEAENCFRKMLEIQPDSALARKQLVAGSRKKSGQAEIEPLSNLLNQRDLPPERRIAAQFALGTALDGAERFDEAFAHFEAANLLAKQQRASSASDTIRKHFRRGSTD